MFRKLNPEDTKPNLNGYSPLEMASMFRMGTIPENVIFNNEFYNLIENDRGFINN